MTGFTVSSTVGVSQVAWTSHGVLRPTLPPRAIGGSQGELRTAARRRNCGKEKRIRHAAVGDGLDRMARRRPFQELVGCEAYFGNRAVILPGKGRIVASPSQLSVHGRTPWTPTRRSALTIPVVDSTSTICRPSPCPSMGVDRSISSLHSLTEKGQSDQSNNPRFCRGRISLADGRSASSTRPFAQPRFTPGKCRHTDYQHRPSRGIQNVCFAVHCLTGDKRLTNFQHV